MDWGHTCGFWCYNKLQVWSVTVTLGSVNAQLEGGLELKLLLHDSLKMKLVVLAALGKIPPS